MIILLFFVAIFASVIWRMKRESKLYKAFLQQKNITVTKEAHLGNSNVTSRIVLDDENKKLYKITAVAIGKTKIRYTEINFSDIVQCKTFLDGSVTTADGLGIIVGSMNEEKLIREAGIKVITNDPKDPSIKFSFIDKRKGTKVSCNTYTLGSVSEWAELINMRANNNTRVFM